MEYKFKLEWKELDEELREQKIDEYIQKMIDEGIEKYYPNYFDERPEYILHNPGLRVEVEYEIECRFPIYF